MMLEQHDALTIATLLNRNEPGCINALAPFVHAEWYGVCVDAETGTVKCDTPAQHRAAERLLTVFGLNPEHPDAWLRPCFGEDVSDEQVSEMVEKVAKVAAEKKLDLAMLKTAIPERIAGNGEAVKPVLLNMRRLRAWIHEQFPLTDSE